MPHSRDITHPSWLIPIIKNMEQIKQNRLGGFNKNNNSNVSNWLRTLSRVHS